MKKNIISCILLSSILLLSSNSMPQHYEKGSMYVTKESIKIIHIQSFKEYENKLFKENIVQKQYPINQVKLYKIPLSEDLQKYTYNICKQYNISSEYPTILAIMWHESNFTSDLISPTDDYGIMQINKCNHKGLAKKLHITNFLDTKSNILAGVYMYANAYKSCKSRTQALLIYNLGYYGMKKYIKHGYYNSTYSIDVENKIKQLSII